MPVKTKIRDTERAAQFCSAEVKQTQSSKLFPLRFKILCKTQRKPGYLTLPPLRFKLCYVRARVFHRVPDSIHLASLTRCPNKAKAVLNSVGGCSEPHQTQFSIFSSLFIWTRYTDISGGARSQLHTTKTIVENSYLAVREDKRGLEHRQVLLLQLIFTSKTWL